MLHRIGVKKMKSKIKVIVIGLIILCLAGVYAIIDKAVSIYDTSCDTSAFQSITLEQGKKLDISFIYSNSISLFL